MFRCFQHRIGADLGLHYVKCPKVPFRVMLAIYEKLTSIDTNCVISSPNPMFDHLLESSILTSGQTGFCKGIGITEI